MSGASYTWKITYSRFEPEQESLRETLCVLGNGYFGTRGASPESVASKIHYPGTYVAGLYNKLTTHIAGRTIVNEDFVNCPNWLFLTFRVGDGEWFCPSTSKLVSYGQELNMLEGRLNRRMISRNGQQQETLIESTLIVHMQEAHLAVLKYVITPRNYSDCITVASMLDGNILNTGVERYRKLNCRHLRPSSLGAWGRNGVYLSMKTSQSKVEISQACKLRIFEGDRELKPKINLRIKGKEIIGQEFKIFAQKGKSYTIEKTIALYTSKDKGVENPQQSAIKLAKGARRFNILLKSHKKTWQQLWDKCDIQIEADTFSQKMLRLHIFHMLQVASPHNAKIDAGLPARGLHGEAYRGHIFWDELFALSFYDLHLPKISRALLLYRYRRLGAARAYAKEKGYKGAMFPWQSGSTGKEETQVLHLNPMSGLWGPDFSSHQRHVSFAIAYNVWRHYLITKDFDFLGRFGAEIFLSIAQFACSLLKHSAKDRRFHTFNIMGPDEFHEKYPHSRKPGLKDNAYSNVMIAWILQQAHALYNLLSSSQQKKILRKLKIKEKDIEKWRTIARRIGIIINDEGIISQFDGYFKLKELDWEKYLAKYRNIHRMDRILKAEGKSPDAYKVSKQADVLMIFYLFPLFEIIDIFKRLGITLDKRTIKKNFDYYAKRTSHGSSLSNIVHCFVAQQLEMYDQAWHLFVDALNSDFYDTQGGTTREGIHIGLMGGSLDIAVRGFAGIDVLEDRIRVNPHLPEKWQRLKLKCCYQGRWIFLTITKNQVEIFIQGPSGRPYPALFEINYQLYHLLLGKKFRIPLKKK